MTEHTEFISSITAEAIDMCGEPGVKFVIRNGDEESIHSLKTVDANRFADAVKVFARVGESAAADALCWPPAVGSKVRFFWCKGHFANTLYHVRAHVDDRLVVRSWSYTKSRWSYEVMHKVWWEVNTSQGFGPTVTVEPPGCERCRG